MCAAIVLSALCVWGPAARADDTTDYVNQILQDQQQMNDYLTSIQQTQDYITQTNDYVNQINESVQQTNDYINQINENVQQTQDYITQINDAATDGNFSGPGGAAIHFSGNLVNGGYYYYPSWTIGK
jgi:septal ring factor EnvC (AmiA/AmiB activator)